MNSSAFNLVSRVLAEDGIGVGVNIPGTAGNMYNIYTYATAVIGFLYAYIFTPIFVLLIMYAGFKYLTSQGDSKKVGDAKEWFMGAIFGYLFLYFIRVIAKALGFIG